MKRFSIDLPNTRDINKSAFTSIDDSEPFPVKPLVRIDSKKQKYFNIYHAQQVLQMRKSQVEQNLNNSSVMQTERYEEALQDQNSHRERIFGRMPTIRVSSKDPNLYYLKQELQRFKDERNSVVQQQNQHLSPCVNQKHDKRKSVGNISAQQDYIQNDLRSLPNLTDNPLVQQVVRKQKQVQIALQQQLNKHRTLQQVNEDLLHCNNTNNSLTTQPVTSTRSNRTSTLTKRVRVGSVATPSTRAAIIHHHQHQCQNLLDGNSSMLSNQSHLMNHSVNQKDSPKFKSHKTILQYLLEQNEAFPKKNSEYSNAQRVHFLNDKFKLNYDKDTFIQFCQLKKSLQSQNILFAQIKEQQLSKGLTVSQTENINDYFVSVKSVVSSQIIRYITIGGSMVFFGDKGYMFGGKCNPSNGCLINVTYEKYQSTLKMNYDTNTRCDILNRYGSLVLPFRKQIIIVGGEQSTSNQGLNSRLLLGDLVFYDPTTHTYEAMQFRTPYKRVRAMAGCILGKYLFYYGGLMSNGELQDQLIRVNLTKENLHLVSWKNVDIVKNNDSDPPPLAYTQLCPIFYDQRMQQFELREELEKFKLRDLSGDINWRNMEHYIMQEGIYLFGGINHLSEATNDLYILALDDHDKLYWIKPDVKGQKPVPRYMHQTNYYKEGNVLIVNGGRNDVSSHLVLSDMFVLHLDSLTWAEVTSCTTKLKPRFNFLSSIIGSKLLILGGQTTNFKMAHDYEVIELDQEVNFSNHSSKYLFKKLGLFIKQRMSSIKPTEEQLLLQSQPEIQQKKSLVIERQSTSNTNQLVGQRYSSVKSRGSPSQFFHQNPNFVTSPDQFQPYSSDTAARKPTLYMSKRNSLHSREVSSPKDNSMNRQTEPTYRADILRKINDQKEEVQSVLLRLKQIK